MKKYFLLLLSVLFCSACSSDTDDNQENVIDGTYKYHEGGIAVSVFISKGQCCGMTIYNDWGMEINSYLCKIIKVKK